MKSDACVGNPERANISAYRLSDKKVVPGNQTAVKRSSEYKKETRTFARQR